MKEKVFYYLKDMIVSLCIIFVKNTKIFKKIYVYISPLRLNPFEFIKLSKFELERELPQTTDQSKVVNLVSRL